MPALLANESLRQWAHRVTAKARSDIANYERMDSGIINAMWRSYQLHVHNACEPLWRLVTRRKRLADYDFYRMWSSDLQIRPSRRRFGMFIYVPIPWHQVVEQYGMLRRDTAPLKLVAELFRKLDFEHFDHFVTVGQASFEQAERYALRDGFTMPNVHKLSLIFASRLENMERYALRQRLNHREVTVPLLYSRRAELQAATHPPVYPGAIFSGACTCSLRSRLNSNLATSSAYDMSRVDECGNKRNRSEYIATVHNTTWVLVPRGSSPAAYSMAETIQAARLPAYIYGFKSRSKAAAPLPPAELLAHHLPFVDLGLDWNKLGAVFTAAQLESIPHSLAGRNASSQLEYVARHRPLFTVDGTYRYILAKLATTAAAAIAQA